MNIKVVKMFNVFSIIFIVFIKFTSFFDIFQNENLHVRVHNNTWQFGLLYIYMNRPILDYVISSGGSSAVTATVVREIMLMVHRKMSG